MILDNTFYIINDQGVSNYCNTLDVVKIRDSDKIVRECQSQCAELAFYIRGM